MQEEEGGECSSFKQGVCFLELFCQKNSAWRRALSKAEQGTLKNLRVGESFEV